MCGREEALKVRISSLDRKRPLAAAPFGVVVQALRGHDRKRWQYTPEKVVRSSSYLASLLVVTSGCPRVPVRPSLLARLETSLSDPVSSRTRGGAWGALIGRRV